MVGSGRISVNRTVLYLLRSVLVVSTDRLGVTWRLLLTRVHSGLGESTGPEITRHLILTSNKIRCSKLHKKSVITD